MFFACKVNNHFATKSTKITEVKIVNVTPPLG